VALPSRKLGHRSIRATSSVRVLVVSELSHHPTNHGRECDACGARWTVQFPSRGGIPTVWRRPPEGGKRHKMPRALLDWSGNNVAVECCVVIGRARRAPRARESVL
jgi:hypothetical protein